MPSERVAKSASVVPTVVVAMIAWGLIGAVVVLALRFVFR